MEALLRDFMADRPGWREQRVFPAVNVTEDAEHVYLRAELPGMEASALDLSVEQNKITLRGSRSIPAEGDDVSFHRRERAAGSFARTIELGLDIDAEGVEAEYRDGLLTITAPKAPEAKPRQITVRSN